jgi:uncharacterized protein
MSTETRTIVTRAPDAGTVPATGFQCRKCGNCCRPRGYIRLLDGELEQMAEFVGMAVHDFTRAYTRLMESRIGLTLVEKNDGACVFLSDDGECIIQSVKPKQCRDFPVRWNYPGFEKNCRAMKETCSEHRRSQTSDPGSAPGQ